jgi:hypothetical protein
MYLTETNYNPYYKYVKIREVIMATSVHVHPIYQLMNDYNIQFSYKGPITQEILISIGESIKETLHKNDCDTKVIKRIFSILVESAHNILKYSSEKMQVEMNKKPAGVGVIGIGKVDHGMFVIFTGNIIKHTLKAEMTEKLDYLNSLNSTDLQQYYSKQLKGNTIQSDGSAGLGLIEMARKSDRPIDYNFIHINDDEDFFELKIYVKIED